MCQYGGKSKTLEAAQTWQDGPQLGPCPPKVTVASTYCVPGKSRPSPGPAPALGTEALGHGGCFFLSGDSPGRKCLHHSPGQHQAAHRLNLTDLRSQGSTSPINTQGTFSGLRLAELATPSTLGFLLGGPQFASHLPACCPPSAVGTPGAEASHPTAALSSAPLLKHHVWSNGSLMLAPITGLTLAFQTQIDRWLSTQPLGRLTRHPK